MQGQGSLLIVRMSGVRVPLQLLASIISARTMPSSDGTGARAWEPPPRCRPSCVLAILALLGGKLKMLTNVMKIDNSLSDYCGLINHSSYWIRNQDTSNLCVWTKSVSIEAISLQAKPGRPSRPVFPSLCPGDNRVAASHGARWCWWQLLSADSAPHSFQNMPRSVAVCTVGAVSRVRG